MSSYTREQVIQEKKCGIKYFDESCKLIGRENVLNRALEISRQFPDIWGPGWSNFSWALGNACIETVKRGQISQTWNLNEVLTDEEMLDIGNKLNISITDYTPLWNRKVLKPKTKKV